MLALLGYLLEPYYGPFRLFTSHLFLSMVGLVGCFGLTWTLLPHFFRYLPTDRGRAHAVDSAHAKGKPTGAGIVFIALCLLVALLVVPFTAKQIAILILTAGAMFCGYWDDRSHSAWHEYTKGGLDLLLAVLAALVFVWKQPPVLWLPLTTAIFHVAPVIYVVFATLFIWLCINATNCSDGVDGLSGTMILLAFVGIGAFLYLIVGHVSIAQYLRVPYYQDAAPWGILLLTFVGGIAGYLWYNAYPSQVLMGDAGSRALGFLLGVALLQTGNPCMLLVAGSVLCVNGGTGLVKVALLRFFKIRIFHTIRFPLHDHVRHAKHWSNTQVLVRFTLIQILVTIILFGMLIKIR